MSENYKGKLLKKHKQKHNSEPAKAKNHPGASACIICATPGSPLL
jgi:hypothetical protein